MKKKILSLFLVFSMLLGGVATTAASTTSLTDIAGTKYETAVNSLQALGIIDGYEDGTYRGEKSITRAELTKLLVTMLNFVAVDSYKGATKFADVPAEYWASGYINIAADRGIVNGYEDGTFRPDEPVKYSEAITMIMRVLGYQNVIESKGTWPINYISKARELNVLDNVTYNNYADNATRGDVAILIWNALHVQTWGVISESQANGLTYGPCDSLLTKLYTNYVQIEDTVIDINIKEDKEVILTLEKSGDVAIPADTDFLNLYGRKVSLTYDTDKEIAIQVTVLDTDKVVSGYRSDLIEEGYTFSEDEFTWGAARAKDTDYIFGVIDKKKEISYSTRYSLGESAIVEKITVKDDKVTVKCDTKTLKISTDAIVLIDGKWAAAADLKAGDVITVLKTGKLYAAARTKVEGTFEAVAETKNNRYVTVDGEKYSVLNGVKSVIEVDEDGDKVNETSLDTIVNDKNSKFYDEDVTLYIDFLGEVAKITFEEIKQEKTEDFHILTYVLGYWVNYADRELTAYAELDGEEYEFRYNILPTKTNVNGGDLVYVELDNKDRIVEFYDLTELTNQHGNYQINDYLINRYYNLKTVYKDSYIENQIKVNSDTVIIKVNAVTEDEEIQEFELERLSKDDLEDMGDCIVIVDQFGIIPKAKYIYTWDKLESTDKYYGMVESYMKENGKSYLTIDNVKYEVGVITVEYLPNQLEDRAIEYTINDGVIDITRVFTYEDIRNAEVITEAEDDYYIVNGNTLKEIDENKIILVAEVDEEEIVSMERIDVEDLTLRKDDKIVEDSYLYIIVREY